MEDNIANLEKTYDAQVHERSVYRAWEESGAFAPRGKGAPFAIMMPPPNVTGVLHLGHALENALMDTKIRFERMRGKQALLLPGIDHAAVATQARVEKDLIAAGHADPRKEFGREKLLEIIREYAEKNKKTMLSQLRTLGTSCDWSRLAYTIDEKRSVAVVTMFKKMYDDGLIYRGYRVVNWSVVGQSTCSDDELVHVERKAKVYTFKYSKDFPIPIATTRPETKLGDTAVAVHPDDKRYAKYIGKTFTVDVGAAKSLSIRVIADKIVDPSFGTGALGVTPAHSMIDFEMKEKHNLELIPVIGIDDRMTKEAGQYAGLTVLEAREKFVTWLKKEKLLMKEEEISQNVATSDRFGDVVEALPMRQWFVAVKKKIPGRGKTLKDLMREAGEKIEIQPDRYKKVYYQWIDNLRDWCISRQVWWGHRIPVWYCYSCHDDPKKYAAGEYWMVGEEKPDACIRCGEDKMHQDNDTLDTWFSSGLWTFSTLGWPAKTNDLKTFHPTAWMTMGYEILFFWMARMILMSEYALKQIPFKQVHIHGILRDAQGKKFSKSLRNAPDPSGFIQKYGTDALRLAVLAGTTPGNDSSFSEEKVEHYQHFVNKLWNISRYILMTVENRHSLLAAQAQTSADYWILAKLEKTIEEITKNLEGSQFSAAVESLYKFVWHELADLYVEAAKIELKMDPSQKEHKDRLLMHLLDTVLRLAHPMAPFVTESIWKQIDSSMLMVTNWPKSDRRAPHMEYDAAFSCVVEMKDIVQEYRRDRSLSHSTPLEAEVKTRYEIANYVQLIERWENIRIKLEIDGSHIGTSYRLNAAQSELSDVKRAEIEKYIASLEKKLADKAFTKNAPKAVVEAEKKKLADAKAKLGL